MDFDIIWFGILVYLVQFTAGYRVTGICQKPELVQQPKLPGVCLPSEQHLNVFVKYGYKDKNIPKDLSGYQPHLLHESSVVRYVDELGRWLHIASGSFADVFDGELTETGERIVIKQFNEDTTFKEIDLECRILMYLSEFGHYFPKCYGYLLSSSRLSGIALVLEHITDTENVRTAIPRREISMYQWMQIFEQVVKYLKFLHSKFILHNDINRGNILIRWEGREPIVFMIDPGQATFRHGDYSTKPSDPRKAYTFFDPTAEYFESNPSRDVYRFAYVLLRLDTERPNEDLRILRKWCRQTDPVDRPTTDELLHRIQALQIKYKNLEHGAFYSKTNNRHLQIEFQKMMSAPIPIADTELIEPDPHSVSRVITYESDHSSFYATYNNTRVLIHLYQNNFNDVRQEARINVIAEPTGIVPKFYGLTFVGMNLDNVALVQEYVENAIPLYEALNNTGTNWDMQYRQIIVCELARAVSFFHSKNMLINNIHPANILVVENTSYPILKWTDFNEVTDSIGAVFKPTSNYQAPEVQAGFHSSFASDIFSLGRIFQDLFKYSTHEMFQSTLHIRPLLRPNISEIEAITCKSFKLKDTGVCHQYDLGLSPPKPSTCTKDEELTNMFQKYGYFDTGLPADFSEFKPYLLHESTVVRHFDIIGEWQYLSNGTFATIYTGHMRESGSPVVIKQFKQKTDFFEIERECRILMYLEDTGYFPKLYGYMPAGPLIDNMTIILEHLVGTESITTTSERPDVSMFQWILIFQQFLEALQSIHRKYILHNDLHRENILIKWNGSFPRLYIIDTGFSTFREGTYQNMSPGTLKRYPFFPPESVNFESNPSMDVYGFGYVMQKVNENVHNEDLQIIADWCRQKYPDDRPTTDELLERLKGLKLKYKDTGKGYHDSMNGVLPKNARVFKFMTEPIPILLLEDLTPMPSLQDPSKWLALDDDHGSYLGKHRNRSAVIRVYAHRRFSQIRHEALINLHLNNSGIIPSFYGLVFYDENLMDTAFIQEYVENSVPLSIAIKEMNMNWTDEYRKSIACEIVKSINLLHRQHILINNIQASNILYINNGTSPSVKFTNLHDHSDSSGLLRDEDSTPPFYAAPEVRQDSPTSFSSDVYSICLILKDLFAPSKSTVINALIDSCLNNERDLRPSLDALIDVMCKSDSKPIL